MERAGIFLLNKSFGLAGSNFLVARINTCAYIVRKLTTMSDVRISYFTGVRVVKLYVKL